MLAALQHAADRLTAEVPPDRLVVLTAPWRGVDPWQLGGATVRGGWDARALVPDEPVVVHWGEAAVVEASGPSRFAIVRDAGHRLLSQLIRTGEADSAPPPRLWGGLSFSTHDPRVGDAAERLADNPWRGFGDARFVLPRWVVGVGQAGAYVQLAISAGEILERGVLEQEIRAVLDSHLGGPPADDRAAYAQHDASVDPGQRAFVALVERALKHIEQRSIEKVVVARAERHALKRPLDVACCLRRLAATQPGCVHFAFPGDEQVLVGATPEKLAVRRGSRLETEALAGTARPSEEAARELLASEKDRREHALVVYGITRALRRSGARVEHPEEPDCRALAQVVHLVTPIVASGAERHVLDWVADLHPTPAMGGWPKREAVAFIRAHEPVPRGWYASPVGWFDERGDGTFVVAIRSAVVDRDSAWLFAGAGVVRGSDPERELEETAHKLAAMRGALEISP